MKKNFKLLALLMAIMLVAVLLPGCGGGDDDEFEIPEEIQALADHVASVAAKYAKELDGGWGDLHEDMMESGLEEDYDSFEAMRDVLIDILEESGARYVYAMYPEDISDSEAPFFITVDGSEDPDEFGVEYELELPFVKAWYGITSSSSYAWEDIWGGTYCWSAYAPIHDSNGDVVAILGVDWAAPEIRNFPEWNVDHDDWNELEEW